MTRTRYPCIRMQTTGGLGVIVTDLGPGHDSRFRLPTDGEVETLPPGPPLTVAELNLIHTQDRYRERAKGP